MGLAKFAMKATAGELLFQEGEETNEMFVLQSGGVRLTRTIRGKETVVADLAAGEFFGEMSVLNGRPRTATATVTEDATLLKIGPKTFAAMIRGNTEIAVRLIKTMAKRLDAANLQIENLLLRDANSRVVHALINSVRRGGESTDAGYVVEIGVSDLQDRTGITEDKVEAVLERMARSHLITRSEFAVTIPNLEKLEEFLEFLELREQFGD